MYIFTQPLHQEQAVTQGQFVKRSTVSLNLEFSCFSDNVEVAKEIGLF